MVSNRFHFILKYVCIRNLDPGTVSVYTEYHYYCENFIAVLIPPQMKEAHSLMMEGHSATRVSESKL